MQRRQFFLTILAAGVAADSAEGASSKTLEDKICLFTDYIDHIEGITFKEVAQMLEQLGVTGVDLTVRPGGLVKPERVKEDLPKAAEVFAEHGQKIRMLNTSITSAADVGDILSTAKSLGIGYYKLGYMRYDDMDRWRERRGQARKQLAELIALGKKIGIHAGFHNHSGPVIGGVIWDCLDLVERHDKQWLGVFFDVAHATVEGGKIGWNIGFRRARERVTMAALKDFFWEKVNGKWITRWVPLGQGMVDFAAYLPLLADTPFPGPLSLQIEYDPGGKTKTERLDRAREAADRDLQFLRKRIQ